MASPAAPSAADKTAASLLSRLSPVPAFPEYTGPHKVGTVDVEIPVSALSSPSPAPEGSSDIHTVQFRIFYPAAPDSAGKRITWLPAPQRLHISAYTQFLGAGSLLASVLSFLPRHLHYTSIPVHKNAPILHPDSEPSQSSWPTVIFSHGLGGNRNAYSHNAGSLASHGMVVICPEHRDGSAAMSLIRDPENQDHFFVRNTRRVVPYQRIPHTQTPEIWEERNRQMRIRLWELSLGFEALLAIDKGIPEVIRSNLNGSTPVSALSQFAGLLDVQRPGKVIFAGHSFGAATIVQFLKSTYYADHPDVVAMAHPLFTPSPDSGIRKQVTMHNPVILQDMWCFPLLSATAAPLYNLPLPLYADLPSAPGGGALLAIESEAFFKWKDHLHAKARILSPEPSEVAVSPDAFVRPDSRIRLGEPNFFYVQNSAHLNQSDFGILFPWLTRRVFGAEQPERCLRLNLRAQLQFLRNNGYPVARTWLGDLVDGPQISGKQDLLGDSEAAAGHVSARVDVVDGIHDDKAILDRSTEAVEAWRWIDIVGMGAEAGPGEIEITAGTRKESKERQAEEGERRMEGEMEPNLAAGTAEKDMVGKPMAQMAVARQTA